MQIGRACICKLIAVVFTPVLVADQQKTRSESGFVAGTGIEPVFAP